MKAVQTFVDSVVDPYSKHEYFEMTILLYEYDRVTTLPSEGEADIRYGTSRPGQCTPVPRPHVRAGVRRHSCLISRQGSGWAFVTPLYGDTASLRGNYPAAMPRCSTGAVFYLFIFKDSVQRGRLAQPTPLPALLKTHYTSLV